MSKQVFINYWIGQEPNPPSPTLDQMPACVDITPLAFVHIGDDYTLNFDFLTTHFPASQIQGWIKTIRAKGIKVLFSIESSQLGSMPEGNIPAFITNVVENVKEWGVDGIDFDFEPIVGGSSLLPIIKGLREALGPNAILTSPIYGPWASDPLASILKQLPQYLDHIMTMDYSSYPGRDCTIEYCKKYAGIMGGWEKLVIGISCMEKSQGDFTPLEDAEYLAQYAPDSGSKGGAMLYTFSYDVMTRVKGGTGYPDGTYTKTIGDIIHPPTKNEK